MNADAALARVVIALLGAPLRNGLEDLHSGVLISDSRCLLVVVEPYDVLSAAVIALLHDHSAEIRGGERTVYQHVFSLGDVYPASGGQTRVFLKIFL